MHETWYTMHCAGAATNYPSPSSTNGVTTTAGDSVAINRGVMIGAVHLAGVLDTSVEIQAHGGTPADYFQVIHTAALLSSDAQPRGALLPFPGFRVVTAGTGVIADVTWRFAP